MDEISNIIRNYMLPDRLSEELSWNVIQIFERKLEETDATPAGELSVAVLDKGFYKQVIREAKAWSVGIKGVAEATVLLPASYIGFSQALVFPDLDITTLGIRNHRFFLFHSAFAVWAMKKLYDTMLARQSGKHTVADKFVNKVLGVLGGSAAWGIGVHLIIDVFQPKSIVFPFVGSLVNGTLIDDNIWLLGNSIWCFKIGHDLFVLALGDDLKKVKSFVSDTFIEPLKEAVKK